MSEAFEAGVFLVDKPAGPTSFRMVQLLRRALAIKKVGHAGTLDPFASGLLILCAGRSATRLVPLLMGGDKEYEALLRFGVETSTQDLEGEVLARSPVGVYSPETINQCLAGFLGEQLQVPPSYSALKHQGKPLYYYARKGIVIEKEARLIRISLLEALEQHGDTLRIRVICGKGTYIRTLAADIGKALGCGAHLIALRRLASGPFRVDAALSGLDLEEPVAARRLLLDQLLVPEALRTLLTEGDRCGAVGQFRLTLPVGSVINGG